MRPIVCRYILSLKIGGRAESRAAPGSAALCPRQFSLTRRETHHQNSAARRLTRTSRRSHIPPTLKSLHWLPVLYRLHCKMLILTCALCAQALPCVDLLQPLSSSGLGSSGQNLLMVPCTCMNIRGDGSFKAAVPPPTLEHSCYLTLLVDPVDDV